MLSKYAAINPATGRPADADAAMIHRRLKVYPFLTRIAKPPPGLAFCGRCFAELVLKEGGAA
eukprot:8080638-Karenia_brevis.AAC.1